MFDRSTEEFEEKKTQTIYVNDNKNGNKDPSTEFKR